MALIHRITHLFRADLHAVIDQLEEPGMLLRQSVREMEEALEQQRRQQKMQQQQQSLLSSRLQELADAISNINDELDVCFTADNEALARVLIKRKLEHQQLHKTLASKQQALQQEISEVQQHIDEYKPRLETMRQKLELLVEDSPQQQSIEPQWAVTNSVTDADVEVALLREKQQRSAS